MSSPNTNDFLLIGRITVAFGVRGELRVALISSRPDYIPKIKQVFLGDSFQMHEVGRFHEHKANVYLLSLKDISTRDQADDLRGTDVYIRASDAAPLAEDEYFLHDLLGLTVQTATGEEIGKVSELIETGANEVLVVRQIGKADVLVPMVRTIVQRIDIAAGVIEVTSLDDIVPK